MSVSSIVPENVELLTLPQAAALCGVSQRTLWGWATAGILTAPAENRKRHGEI